MVEGKHFSCIFKHLLFGVLPLFLSVVFVESNSKYQKCATFVLAFLCIIISLYHFHILSVISPVSLVFIVSVVVYFCM